jgi:hypothetical protein
MIEKNLFVDSLPSYKDDLEASVFPIMHERGARKESTVLPVTREDLLITFRLDIIDPLRVHIYVQEQ